MKKAALAFVLLIMGMALYAQTAVIRELSGEVELKMPGASSYVPAKVGDEISKDTLISTGFRSIALLEAGSTVIAVRPLTRLTLTELSSSAGAETLNVNLQTGRVRVDVNPPAGTRVSTEVRSPIATASVRGTSFEFDTRNLSVGEGTVSFQGNRGGLMLVSAGAESRVDERGRAADPIGTGAAALLPPPPVGVDSSAGISAAPPSTPPLSAPPTSGPTTGGIAVQPNYPRP